MYRRKHLLIGACRADAPSYPLAKRIAAALQRELPESRARVARARDRFRLASLIATGQLPAVLFSRADAAALRDGAPPFESLGPTPLAALFRFGAHRLVCRPDFSARHAWLIARALSAAAPEFAGAGLPAGDPLPAHSGVREFAAGAPAPPADPEPPPEPHGAHAHP